MPKITGTTKRRAGTWTSVPTWSPLHGSAVSLLSLLVLWESENRMEVSAGWPVRSAGGALRWSRSRSAIPSIPRRLGGLSLPSTPCRVAQAPGCQVVSFPTKEVPLKVSFDFLFFLGFLLFFFFFAESPGTYLQPGIRSKP